MKRASCLILIVLTTISSLAFAQQSKEELEESLMLAIEKDDVQTVAKALKAGVSPKVDLGTGMPLPSLPT